MSSDRDVDRTERLRSLVGERLGLALDGGRTAFLGELLGRRLKARGVDEESYLERLRNDPSWEEVGCLAEELTVGETYFFRNREQFQALREVVLPERMRERRASERLSLLSAGCATGEEAYSLAIVVRETVPDPPWNVTIRALDVNPATLAKAARARFSSWALRETPAETLIRWFREDGQMAVLDPTLKAAVRFENHNLARNDAPLGPPGSFDAVFCRNVLMYFAPEVARQVVARLAAVLAPGGYLFLGHAETLRGLSQDFQLLHSHGTFYYQRLEESPRRPQFAVVASPGLSPLASSLAAVAAGEETWVEAIRRTAERVRALTPTREEASRIGAAPTRPGWDLAPPLDLLRQEKFAAALECMQALPPEAASDPDVLLLSAVLLTHTGQLSSAAEVAQRLLALDGLNAGAHYVLALCREGAGDVQGAIHHDQLAIYLDASFAMPRLHLGLLTRRAGDHAAARRELAQALALLEREEPSRLLLFGGGFRREVLLALCRAELEAFRGAA